jgi:hypothetical protein
MSERTKRFTDELDRLIEEGEMLHTALQFQFYTDEVTSILIKECDGDALRAAKYIKTLPDFRVTYQKWYSEGQAVVKQLLPDRLRDFVSYYEYTKVRKSVTFENYMVRDYLQSLQITAYDGEIVVNGSAAIPEFLQQLNIVRAAKGILDSRLMDLKAIVQADVFDSEIESAEALRKSGYLRAAGAICGVIIEKHLLYVCENRKIFVKKKNPGISDLNQLLKDSDVTDVPQWRYVQHLADIRNICDHAKGREPTSDDIEGLISGTTKILKTIF